MTKMEVLEQDRIGDAKDAVTIYHAICHDCGRRIEYYYSKERPFWRWVYNPPNHSIFYFQRSGGNFACCKQVEQRLPNGNILVNPCRG